MATDVLGNRLEKGDIVQVRLEHPSAMGQVVEVKESSLVGVDRRGAQARGGGTVTIQATFVLPIDPSNPVLAMLAKLHRPDALSIPPSDLQPVPLTQ